MHDTNTKQLAERQISGSDLADAANVARPSPRRNELRAVRSRRFLKQFLRARRIMLSATRVLTVMVVGAMVLAAGSVQTLAVQQADAGQSAQSAQQTPAELQQLVAPFALYPDALVAQILAASTYPTQIVEAERWLQKNSKLKGDELATEADKQSWDPSVKALTQFPSVLAKMNDSLAWTSAVGDAYYNQQQDVLDAVQVMRQRAEDAGTLQSTTQQTVATQGLTIVIEPADPNVCYLPIYDPWTVYGAPLAVYPGYMFDPWVGPPYYFGPGIGLGFFGGYGWGWPAWGFNWRRREVIFNHNTYVSRSPSFFHRNPDGRGNFRPGLGGSFPRGNHDVGGSDRNHGAQPNRGETRGFGAASTSGMRTGAFSGVRQGGIERGSASRGQSSFGRGGFGGAGMRGGGGMQVGGGMRGGGSMRGGGGGRHR